MLKKLPQNKQSKHSDIFYLPKTSVFPFHPSGFFCTGIPFYLISSAQMDSFHLWSYLWCVCSKSSHPYVIFIQRLVLMLANWQSTYSVHLVTYWMYPSALRTAHEMDTRYWKPLKLFIWQFFGLNNTAKLSFWSNH